MERQLNFCKFVLLTIVIGFLFFYPAFGQDMQFSPGTSYEIPGSQSSNYLASGDLNGDNIADIVVFPYGPTPEDIYAHILLGVGDGTFHAPIPFTVPAGIFDIVGADFNEDGCLDVALTDSIFQDCYSHFLYIFLGDGDGSFLQPDRYYAGCGPGDIQAGDLNADGSLDLVITCNGGRQIVTFLGNGQGNFGNRAEFSVPTDNWPNCACLGDFSHDGITDIAAGDYLSIYLFAGNGDGTFQSPIIIPFPEGENYVPESFIAEDFNEDRFLDLAIACANGDRIAVYFGQADGSLILGQNFWQDHPLSIKSADFNADGHSELAVGIGYYHIGPRIIQGLGGGEFGEYFSLGSMVGPNPNIVINDFNGDGLMDLAAGYGPPGAPPTTPTTVFLNASDVFVQVAIDIKPGSDPNTINLGSNGNVPVVIFSTPGFDASTIDPASVSLAGATVILKGKGNWMYSLTDVNNDSLIDIIVHVDTTALQLTDSDTEAILEGRTYQGKRFRGSDSIRIII